MPTQHTDTNKISWFRRGRSVHHTSTWSGETYMGKVTIDLDKEPLPIREKDLCIYFAHLI